jgi:hypothetical protein
MVPLMRRTMILTLLSLSLALSLGSIGASATARDADRAPHGLLITYQGWGKLHRGMTAKEAQRTGMVSTKVSRCAAGYQLTKPYAERAFLTWDATKKPWTVRWIVVVGSSDHTREGSHPGTTLAQLRRQHPFLSKVVRGGSLTGQVPSKEDVWVAWVKKPYGTITYHFPYGTRPTKASKVESIVVSKHPVAYYGC